MKPFEVIEHTADVAIIAYGCTLQELFENAARGMFSLICELEKVQAREVVPVSVEADDDVVLLVRWLKELLYHSETKRMLFSEFKVQKLSDNNLEGWAKGEQEDASKAERFHQIKAVTYHGLQIEREGNLWRAQVVFDV